jgi:hypothetical protein
MQHTTTDASEEVNLPQRENLQRANTLRGEVINAFRSVAYSQQRLYMDAWLHPPEIFPCRRHFMVLEAARCACKNEES